MFALGEAWLHHARLLIGQPRRSYRRSWLLQKCQRPLETRPAAFQRRMAQITLFPSFSVLFTDP